MSDPRRVVSQQTLGSSIRPLQLHADHSLRVTRAARGASFCTWHVSCSDGGPQPRVAHEQHFGAGLAYIDLSAEPS